MFSGTIADGSSSGGLALAGGSLTLSGTNTYSGATTLSTGATLTVSGAGTLSNTSGISLAAGSTFNYTPSTSGTLRIGSASALTLASNSTLSTAFGNTISSSGSAAVGGNVFLNLSGTPTAGTPYTVLTAAAGLSSGTYYPVNTNYTYTLTGSSDTSIVVTPTTVVSGLTAEYWAGGFSKAPAVWAVSDGVANSNWSSTDPSLGPATPTPLLPGSGATVYFNSGEPNASAMTLGSSMSVAGIVVNDTGAVAIVGDGNTLTIGSGGITVNGATSTVTIGSALSLAANQNWTNNSTNTLSITGSISGTGGITTAGAIYLSGTNTFSGPTTLSGGTLVVANSLALQNSVVSLSGGTMLFDSAVAGSATFGDISGSGGLSLEDNSGAAVALIVGGSNDVATYSGMLSGTGGLTEDRHRNPSPHEHEFVHGRDYAAGWHSHGRHSVGPRQWWIHRFQRGHTPIRNREHQ